MNENQAFQYAISCLARREHSPYELTQKIKRKYPDLNKADLDKIIDQLVLKKYLCPKRYAEAMVRYKASKGYGPNFIKLFLSQQKIDFCIIEQALNQEEVDWNLILNTQYQKAQKKYKTNIVKIKQTLYRRGFSDLNKFK